MRDRYRATNLASVSSKDFRDFFEEAFVLEALPLDPLWIDPANCLKRVSLENKVQSAVLRDERNSATVLVDGREIFEPVLMLFIGRNKDSALHNSSASFRVSLLLRNSAFKIHGACGAISPAKFSVRVIFKTQMTAEGIHGEKRGNSLYTAVYSGIIFSFQNLYCGI